MAQRSSSKGAGRRRYRRSTQVRITLRINDSTLKYIYVFTCSTNPRGGLNWRALQVSTRHARCFQLTRVDDGQRADVFECALFPVIFYSPTRYPLVTLEKTTGADTLHWDPSTLKWRVPITCQVGSDVSKCGCCQEDNFIRHATQLKAANPRQHIVAYMNTEIAYPWYRYVLVLTSVCVRARACVRVRVRVCASAYMCMHACGVVWCVWRGWCVHFVSRSPQLECCRLQTASLNDTM